MSTNHAEMTTEQLKSALRLCEELVVSLSGDDDSVARRTVEQVDAQATQITDELCRRDPLSIAHVSGGQDRPADLAGHGAAGRDSSGSRRA